MALITEPNMHLPGTTPGDLHTGDEFYEALLNAHQGLSEAQSHAFHARLILTLANHIGDVGVLKQAIELAQAAD
jgi:Protein of unknown function (DUF2783)